MRGSGFDVDDTHVYWSDTEGGTVKKTPLAGHRDQAVALVSGQQRPWVIATDAAHVYWVTDDRLMRVPKSGGLPLELARLGLPVWAILLHEGYVYWSESDRILRAPTSAGATQVVQRRGGLRLAVVRANLYFTSHDKELFVAPLAGGTPRKLATLEAWPFNTDARFVLDDNSAYWMQTRTRGKREAVGRVMKVSLGGGPAEVVAHAVPLPRASDFDPGLELDASAIYFVGPDGRIGRLAPK